MPSAASGGLAIPGLVTLHATGLTRPGKGMELLDRGKHDGAPGRPQGGAAGGNFIRQKSKIHPTIFVRPELCEVMHIHG